eukprot:gene992-1075_t
MIGGCEKFCFHLNTFHLYLLNLVDFCFGCALLSFSVYLFAQLGEDAYDPSVAWLCWCCIAIGLLTWLIVMCSVCAIANVDCRWAMRPSAFLSGLAAIINLVLGILGLALRHLFNVYLQDHGTEMGLSDQDLYMIKTWYLVIVIFFFCSVLSHGLRIWMSNGFVETSRLIDSEFESILTRETEEWEHAFDKKQSSTKEKYRNLRDYYKQRFGRPSSLDDGVV